jgi:plasmid stabilization system protein ParE
MAENLNLENISTYPTKILEKYLMFYRTMEEEEVVEIVRIVHGVRDLPRLFGEKES